MEAFNYNTILMDDEEIRKDLHASVKVDLKDYINLSRNCLHGKKWKLIRSIWVTDRMTTIWQLNKRRLISLGMEDVVDNDEAPSSLIQFILDKSK